MVCVDDALRASYSGRSVGTPPPIRYEEMAPSFPEGPVDLDALIEGQGPLELDVGFGRGRSLLERAEAHPDVRVIGIELKAKWAFKVAERLEKRGLANARAFRADARELLARAGPDGCLRRVYVHFPDPWWKKRHRKRRVVSGGFLDTLARLLAPGGELFVQTDVPDRADDYEALMDGHAAFEPAGDEGYRLDENPFGARSNREVRAAEDGLPVHRLLARRVSDQRQDS
jgi:tRNA (guanine-N7-)-methyltransferase